ncbi:MAG: SH3 domain-containing protein [Synergistaceae bacterium]|nr:SH3 domain-containing protein [Synergistaceae bacterium]
MKKLIVVLWLMILSGCAFGVEYPELGVCIGDNVRLREDPGTDGKIIGRADTGTQFVILGEAYVDGQKWYEIDHPTKKGSAYIVAKYANYGWLHGNNGVIPTGKDFIDVRLTFGIYPDKARALFGNVKKDEFGNLEYPGLTLRYDDEEEGTIHQVQLTKGGIPIAGIQTGDSMKKLLQLGMPEDYLKDFLNAIEEAKNNTNEDEAVDGPEGWTYRNEATEEEIFFQFSINDKGEPIVDMIIWTRPVAAG